METKNVIVRCGLEALPDPKIPLLDLGAGHGLPTATAICYSRDVIHVEEAMSMSIY